MAKFILRRLLILIPTLFIVSMVVFAVTANLPGDRVATFLGMDQRITPEERARVEALLGLDGSIVTQYGRWLGRVFQGDFGNSMTTRQPATEMLGNRIWNTFILNGTSFVIASIISILVGIRQAVKKYKFTDNAWTVVSLLGISVPSFYLGYVLLFFVAIPFGLPFGGMRDTIKQVVGYANIFENLLDLARHMLLPVTVMVFMNFAVLTRYVRGTMIDVMNQDYIRTARSKGLKEKVVIYRHAFKNALIPLVTLLGLYIPSLFAGAVILEQVFLWPGIGRALVGAITARDNSVVMLAMVFFATLTMLGNLLSDVLYSVADPRIRTK